MWKPLAVLFAFVCCALGAGTAWGISFEARDFDALAGEADQIVIGTATAASSRRTGAREIVTDHRFDNLQILKGTVPADSLTLTMLGGTFGTETLTVAGAPAFQRGTRYLLFIRGNGSVMFPLVGGHQGIFQIRRDAASGVPRVHDHAGRPLARLPGRTAEAMVGLARVSAGESITEAAFVDAIRNKVTGGDAR